MQRLKHFFNNLTARIAIMLILGLTSLPAWAEDDDLKGVMGSVKSTFGVDSTFMKLLYLAEIIVSVYTYHKTKNFAVLLGIIFISVFVNYAIPHWVFTA